MDINKEKIENLLKTLNLADLNSLVGTVTQYFIREEFDTKEEAIKIILLHSPDIESILKRKIITRGILFNYLTTHNVALCPPLTKDNLIESLLNYWNINEKSNYTTVSSNLSQTFNNTITNTDNTCKNVQVQTKTNDSINEMALQFSEWFYNMFNQSEPIEIDHFWQDCNFKLNLKNGINSSVITEVIENSAEETVNLLYKTKMEHRIFLNPNLLPEGCQGRMNQHGLVYILVCGTIHVNNMCVGVFEQVFGLVRDPHVNNNWKIKNSELNLRSQSNTNLTPRLTDNELTSHLLQINQ